MMDSRHKSMPKNSTKQTVRRKRFVGTTCPLLFLILFLLLASTPAAHTQEQDNAPRIVVAEDPLQMGTIPNGRISRDKVIIRNEGSAVLRIHQVRASCGCTIVVDYPKEIPPGGQGAVTFGLDPRKIAGFDVTKSVMISSNDPKTPMQRVRVMAKIDPEFTLVPPSVEFGDIPPGQTAERTVILRQIQEGPMNLLRIGQTTGPEQITWSFEETPEEEWQTPGKREWRITVRVSPEMKPTPFYAAARLMTNVQRLRRGLWLSARGKVIQETKGQEDVSQKREEEDQQ